MSNYIDDQIERARIATGDEVGPDAIAREFAKMDLPNRVTVLSSIEREEGPRGDAISSPREAAKRHPYVSALKDMHARLLEVKR